MILFVLPFLGGRCSYFEKFWMHLKNVKIMAVDFKKDGESFEECLQYFQEYIETNAQGETFSLWGHSVGALYAYELGCILKDNKNLCRIFLSGRTSPKYDFTPPLNVIMDKREFKSHVQKRYGYSDTIMKSRIGEVIIDELQKGYLIHRYDSREPKMLNRKFIVLYATDDELSQDIESWDQYSNQLVDYYNFTGGHFFIMKYMDEICHIIKIFI